MGWAERRASQLCSLITSGSRGWAKYYADTGAGFIRVQNIRRGRIDLDLDDLQHVRPPSNAEGSWTRLQAHDITITITADLGRVGLVGDAVGEAYVNQHVALARPTNSVEPAYLAWFITGPDAQEQLGLLDRGATRSGLGLKDIEGLVVPLPPLAEQRRIVARIEALFARTRRARADLERVAPLAGRYFSATLAHAFQGTLTDTWRTANDHIETNDPIVESQGPYDLPEGWAWRPLPSLGELARGKSRHRPRNYPALYGGPYPFIQTGDVRAARGRLGSFHQTYSEAGLAQSRLWPRDTLCITIAANIAETAILDIEACFPDSVVGFRAMDGMCLPEYVEYFFRTAKEDLAAFAPATAQKNINLETLEAVLVPTPGLSEQTECVSRLSRSEAAAYVCESEATRALTLLDRLEQSILARAFHGELGQQEPADSLPNAAPVTASPTSVRPQRLQRVSA